jgi:hypothetical protein
LWRGSRDGFGSRAFHDRCDGHENTVTLIQDVSGFVFGGFIGVPWTSRDWSAIFNDVAGLPRATNWKMNWPRSFLFTLRNPYNIPPRKFMMNSAQLLVAVHADPTWGPAFGNDILVLDHCNARDDNQTDLGRWYLNQTQVDGKRVFTGSPGFRVHEIEVFKIID